MSRPIRIDIEPDDFSEDSMSSCSTLTPSPTRVPIASRIRQVASDVLPFDYNDNSSLPSQASLDSTDSLTNQKNNKYFIFVIFTNIFLFFLFSLLNKRSVETINPYVEHLFFRSISNYPECADKRHELWRLFTYSFVHGDFFHLFGNSLGLYVVAYTMDRFQSVFKLYFIYFLSIANGCFSFYLTDPYSVLIGASGGVYGLFGAHVANYFYNGDRMFDFEVLTTRLFYTFFLLCDIIPFFLVRAKKVAYQVHYFCTLFGFLTGLTIFKERRLTSFKKYIRLGSLIALCYLHALLLFNYIFNFPSIKGFNYFQFTNIKSCCYEKLINNNTCSIQEYNYI